MIHPHLCAAARLHRQLGGAAAGLGKLGLACGSTAAQGHIGAVHQQVGTSAAGYSHAGECTAGAIGIGQGIFCLIPGINGYILKVGTDSRHSHNAVPEGTHSALCPDLGIGACLDGNSIGDGQLGGEHDVRAVLQLHGTALRNGGTQLLLALDETGLLRLLLGDIHSKGGSLADHFIAVLFLDEHHDLVAAGLVEGDLEPALHGIAQRIEGEALFRSEVIGGQFMPALTQFGSFIIFDGHIAIGTQVRLTAVHSKTAIDCGMRIAFAPGGNSEFCGGAHCGILQTAQAGFHRLVLLRHCDRPCLYGSLGLCRRSRHLRRNGHHGCQQQSQQSCPVHNFFSFKHSILCISFFGQHRFKLYRNCPVCQTKIFPIWVFFGEDF